MFILVLAPDLEVSGVYVTYNAVVGKGVDVGRRVEQVQDQYACGDACQCADDKEFHVRDLERGLRG